MMICKSIFEKYKKRSKKGFTLVEMMVTIAIIAVASGATLSVFLMVHDIQRDASEITVQQYYTGQTERMIRNELQVSSGIDIKPADQLANGQPLADSAVVSDGYVKYDSGTARLTFYRCETAGRYTEAFSVDNVSEVQISVAPLNDTVSDKSGQNYKLFYEVTTAKYTYSGGFVLSNTEVLGRGDTCFQVAGSASTAHTLLWRSDANGGNTNNGSPNYGNSFALTYHRDKVAYNPTSSTTGP